jgi:hypothetical protein
VVGEVEDRGLGVPVDPAIVFQVCTPTPMLDRTGDTSEM